MSTNQILLIILISSLIIGGTYIFLHQFPSVTNESIVENELEKPKIEEGTFGEFTFDKGESMENYKVVDCYYKSQIPDVIIKKDDIVVNNVTGVPFVVCISAGERKTGGYNLSLNDISINRENFQIFIDLFLKVPAKGEMVTQAFTYPSIGVEINEVLDVGEWEVIVTIEQKNGEPLLLRKSFTFSN
ncbi:MAG: hypothetical protein PWQ78_930 [Petrotoga sp.]|uniref:protease complex subunit PrcB family protein n=1 Tax=Petrotoga sp. 8T1HF07.NaAc.6.1 TaxID=1351838 RepID=UPI00192C7CED|nr:protease complex subunit PrcB family protein [Petrotoga sp. 8T1HF07.NaAc.6.1]MBL5981770.1 hypothetical protein [Petrotoga sp. 8T1HF07.NaAc.6.1]MDK2812720.1 hypothetical protein [Petrotoga sp.]